MRRPIVVGLVVCLLLPRADTARASANIIPDHVYRLGSCAPGERCNWGAGVGPACLVSGCTPECSQFCQQETGVCALSPGDAFAGVLDITVNNAPCSGPNGGVVTFALAGTGSNGTQFQLADKVLDLCDFPVACTGRDHRQCSACGGNADCSGGSTGTSDCAPGGVVFFCKDPCFDPVPYFNEADLTNPDQRMLGWMLDARQPFLDVIRTELQSYFPNATGPAVVVDAQQPSAASGTPPKARFCIKVWFLDDTRPLDACTNDATIACTVNADCGSTSVCSLGLCSHDGTTSCAVNADCNVCRSGAPPEVNPSSFTTRVSGRRCNGGSRSEKPCVTNADCTGGACEDTAVTATFAGCPTSLCGDGVRDPGEQCDDQNNADSDGCSATCATEPCWACSGKLGEFSSCTPLGEDTPCSTDENACTLEHCDGSGVCVFGSNITTCSSGDGCCPSGCTALNDSDCFGCPSAPDSGCTSFAQGLLHVDERTAGREKLAVKWKKGPALAPTAFGDPSNGQTGYAVCLYGDGGAPVASYIVDRGGDTCRKKPCWKGLGKPAGSKGYQYTDKERTADGIKLMNLKPSATAGKSQALTKGKGAGLPLGVAAALQGATAATAQLRASDSSTCASVALGKVSVNDGARFKAKSQ